MSAFFANVDPDFRFGFFPVAENIIHKGVLILVKSYYRCLAPGVKEQYSTLAFCGGVLVARSGSGGPGFAQAQRGVDDGNPDMKCQSSRIKGQMNLKIQKPLAQINYSLTSAA